MIELIPAIDIIDVKCVRLSQGDYGSKKVYNENPVEVAKSLRPTVSGVCTWWIWMEPLRIMWSTTGHST